MHRALFLILIIVISACYSKTPYVKNLETFTIHSDLTRDNYIIDIRRPDNFDINKKYSLIYATDGSLGMGEYLLGKDQSWHADLPDSFIVITIAHKGDWQIKRQRDFIPSEISKDSSENFGHADHFYTFLAKELMPAINKKIPFQKTKVFIGHSFGGLFCLYASLKNEKLFDHYFAISPSVWANYSELLKMENEFVTNNLDMDAAIDIYAGSLEVFNKVLSSAREFYNILSSKQYKSLHLNFTEISNANHFSIRKPAIDKILKSLNE